MVAASAKSEAEEIYEPLGCFPKQQNDNDALSVMYDLKCAQADESEQGPCRGGLPFYRLQTTPRVATPPVHQCFVFCSSKGLDLFGLSKSLECRCGATLTNSAVWGESWYWVKDALTLDFQTATGETEEDCDGLNVYRYTAWLHAGPNDEGLKP